MLLYQSEMGGVAHNIIKQALRFGEEIPERIKNKPELFSGLELYFEAFHDLDTERNHNSGLTRIPRSKIVEYAFEYDFDYRQKEDLIFYIRRMDNALLKHLKAKQPSQNEKPRC